MDRHKIIHRLEFHHDFVIYQEVQPKGTIHSYALVIDWLSQFLLERNILEGKLECQAILVDILQQTRAKCTVNLNTSAYDFVGPSIFAYFAPLR